MLVSTRLLSAVLPPRFGTAEPPSNGPEGSETPVQKYERLRRAEEAASRGQSSDQPPDPENPIPATKNRPALEVPDASVQLPPMPPELWDEVREAYQKNFPLKPPQKEPPADLREQVLKGHEKFFAQPAWKIIVIQTWTGLTHKLKEGWHTVTSVFHKGEKE